MFALAVRFELPDDEAAQRFDDLVDGVLPGIAEHEPATLMYVPHRVEGEPLARLFYEVYTDRGALESHEARPATAVFLREISALVSTMRVEHLAPLHGGVGLGRLTGQDTPA